MTRDSIVALQLAKFTGALALAAALPEAYVYLMAFVAIDYITGCMSALYNKKFDSSIGTRGLIKKTAILGCPLILKLIEMAIHKDYNLLSITAIFFTFQEICSIIENLSHMNVYIPKPVLQALIKAKKIMPPAATPAEIDEAFRRQRWDRKNDKVNDVVAKTESLAAKDQRRSE